MATSKPIVRRIPRKLIRIGFAFAVAVVVIGIASGSYALAYSGKLYPGISIAGTNVGGLTKAQAAAQLDGLVQANPPQPLVLIVEGQRFTADPKDLEINYDVDATTNVAWGIGHQINPFRLLRDQVRSVVRPVNLPFIINLNQDRKNALITQIKKTVDHPAADAQIVLLKGAVSVTESNDGTEVPTEVIEAAINNGFGTFANDPITLAAITTHPKVTESGTTQARLVAEGILKQSLSVTIGSKTDVLKSQDLFKLVAFNPDEKRQVLVPGPNQDTIKAYLSVTAKAVNQDPVDANVGIQDGKVTAFSPSQEGRVLDQEDGVQQIAAMLERMIAAATIDPTPLVTPSVMPTPTQQVFSVTLKITTQKPNIASSEIDRLGLKEIIGKGTTDFSGSPDNRIHNIKNGVKFLNGALIKPGDTLSVVSLLGDVSDKSGYLPELVIKENKTTPEFGGGLCQVSTTLFRAALNAGLPITERQNHSYRVVYYERGTGPGLDATVYDPKPDLKFQNDTPGWILIQGRVIGNSVTFELYGTSDGRRSTISDVEIWNVTEPPPPQYVDTPDLPAGQTKRVETAHNGADTKRTYTVFDKSGKQIRRQVFTSHYKAWQARYLRGTGGGGGDTNTQSTPTPEPTATSTPEATATATSTATPTSTPTPSPTP